MSLLLPAETLADAAAAVPVEPTRFPQPLLAEDEPLVTTRPERTLSRWLLRKWCKGAMSAVDVVDAAAQAAPSDQDELLARLAKIQPQNASRDLVRTLRRVTAGSAYPTFDADIPVWDEATQSAATASIPFCLPHEVVGKVAPGPNGVETWTECDDATAARLEGWKNKLHVPEQGPPVTPMNLWGDTAPYLTGQDSVLLLLWGSMVNYSRHWIAVLSKSQVCRCGCRGLHTMDAIWEILRWSFIALLIGKYPSVDHKGRPFEEEWRRELGGQALPLRGACLQFRGDWPWLAYVFDLPSHSARLPCFLCRTTRDVLNPFTDPSLEATWRATVRTHHDMLRERALGGLGFCGVYGIPGFTFDCIMLDLMHMSDLGIAQVTLGNILFEVFEGLGGLITRPQEALGRLVVYLKAAAADLQLAWPFSRMSLENIRQNRQPRLKAKAAKTRHCIPIVAQLLTAYFPPQNEHEQTRLQCLQQLSLMYLELQNWGQGSAERLATACRRHLLLFVSLSRAHIVPGADWVRWRWMPKHHMMLHLTELSAIHGNPANSWNYADENEIGKAAKHAESVHISVTKDTF